MQQRRLKFDDFELHDIELHEVFFSSKFLFRKFRKIQLAKNKNTLQSERKIAHLVSILLKCATGKIFNLRFREFFSVNWINIARLFPITSYKGIHNGKKL